MLREDDGRGLGLSVHIVLKGAMIGFCDRHLSLKIAFDLLAGAEPGLRFLRTKLR